LFNLIFLPYEDRAAF